MGISGHSCLFVLSACHNYRLIALFPPRTVGIPELAGGVQWANNFPHTTTEIGIWVPGTQVNPDMVVCMYNPYNPMARNPVSNKVEGGDQHLKFSFDLHMYTMAYTYPQSYTETCRHTHTHRRERRREGGREKKKVRDPCMRSLQCCLGKSEGL